MYTFTLQIFLFSKMNQGSLENKMRHGNVKYTWHKEEDNRDRNPSSGKLNMYMFPQNETEEIFLSISTQGQEETLCVARITERREG